MGATGRINGIRGEMGMNIKNFFPAAQSAKLKLSPGRGTDTGPFGVSDVGNTEWRII